MDSHRVSLLARRCGVRREQISGDLGQAWLAPDSCPGSRSNEPVKLLWILSEPENGVSQKMLDKLTQISDGLIDLLFWPAKLVAPQNSLDFIQNRIRDGRWMAPSSAISRTCRGLPEKFRPEMMTFV